MTRQTSPLPYTDRLPLLILTGVGAADLTSVAFGRFQAQWMTFITPMVSAAAMLALGWFYRAIRPDARLSCALMGTGYVVAFAALGAPLSYIAASAGLPLQDATLSGLDRALGLDWLTYVDFVSHHPWLRNILLLAYLSFFVQTITTVLVLSFCNRLRRLSVFVGAFMVTSLLTIALSSIIPAEGPWLFLGIKATAANNYDLPLSATSWPAFNGLRDGTFRILTGLHSEGIITFPSLHAALGILFAAAFWQIPVLRWVALGLNITLIVATPIQGSHYFIDVLAGIVIAAIAWFWVEKFLPVDHPSAEVASPSIVPGDTNLATPASSHRIARKFENV
ncbi:MAG: phosphatase PAP2 family protein [Xanthobacteraceae bacterium]|nr:phosphatase PAP2 family protein [Xanthobacteraceae bacterium]